MRLLAELKRRNVIRMAGLYLVGAWLTTQVVGTVLPMFGAPEWVARSVVILLVIGFLPALIVAWVFELTPEGLRRESDAVNTAAANQDIASVESATPQTARRMDRMLLVVMALGLSYFAFDKFVLTADRITAPPSVAATGSGEPVDAGRADAASASTTAAAVPPKDIVRGIAVLPFDNLSPDPDNEFFAGGVYEEVLTKLSRINELRVISRTSMERIAKDDLEVGAIGQRLGVSHVLEGSVRRAGEQIRVTVQLIEAATDAHIWAENYDRKLDDVFAIQSEIALAIAAQLEISLSPQLQANLNSQPTQNQAAYALYLRALDERRSWRAAVTFQAMIELLEPAVAADPDFLEARVLLAEAYGRMNWLKADPEGSFAGKARQLVADILKRWPQHPQSELAQGQLLYNLERDYAQALLHFEAARELLPNDPTVLASVSGSFKRLNRRPEFLGTVRRLVELDPESAINASELIQALGANGLWDEAMEVTKRARVRFPDDEIILEYWAVLKLVQDQDITALLALRSVPFFDRDLADIARYVHGDIDALTRPIIRADLAPEHVVYLHAGRAELLRLAGRNKEAQVFVDQARAMTDLMDEWLDRQEPLAPDAEALRYAGVASVLALLDEPQRAREYLAKAKRAWPEGQQASTATSIDLNYFDYMVAAAERRLGDPEAAWLRLQPWAGQPEYLSHGELLAFQKYYDALYGKSPSYRAYMAKIAGEKR